jgi:hypothetical protein
MRAAIRALLVTGVLEIGERWVEPHALRRDGAGQIVYPFGVLRVGDQAADEAWGAVSTVVEAWPYVDRDTPAGTLDELVAKTRAALDNQRFDEAGVRYLVLHDVTAGRDFLDDDWAALTRPVRFRVYSLAWLTGLTYAPDPIAALQAWTAATWPNVLQTNPATWNPQDATPGVYWRLVTANVAPEGQRSWGAWLEAQIRAHVVAPSPANRLTWVRTIAERLSVTQRLALSDASPLLFREIAADSEADSMRTGQVRLAAHFGVLKPAASPAPQKINTTETKLVAPYP